MAYASDDRLKRCNRPRKLLSVLEFERHLDLGSVRFDLAIGDLHVEFDNLGDAKVSQAL